MWKSKGGCKRGQMCDLKGWMNGVLGHFYALSRLNWAGETWANEMNLDETLPQSSIDRSTLHSAAHRATK